MEHPFLFEREGWAEAANNENVFSARVIMRFGECALCFSGDYHMWPTIENPNCRAVWRNALAAEALLFSSDQRVNRLPFGGLLTDDALPCGKGAPTYGELKLFPAAAALFPMSGDRPRPGRIWAVGAGKDGVLPSKGTFVLEDAEGILNEAGERGIRLYAEAGAGCEGRSWQLAAYLAMDALEAGDLEYNISLAAEWLVTGEMHEDHVRPVGIKNKPELGFNTRRRWLLPDSSLEVFHRVAGSRGLTELSVTGVRTLGDAIEAVRGCVARRRPDEPWPRDVVCLHVAIGDDPSPVLRLLALTNPRELHLWSLDKSSEAVSALHDAVRETYPRMAVRIHGNIPAAELDKISRALHDHFGANPATTSVLFDITDGAWLFRVAVEAVSRRSHFAVVCKVSESNSYIKLWNERGVPHYCHLATALSRPARPGKRHPVDRNVVPRSPSSLLGELRTVDQLLGNDQEV